MHFHNSIYHSVDLELNTGPFNPIRVCLVLLSEWPLYIIELACMQVRFSHKALNLMFLTLQLKKSDNRWMRPQEQETDLSEEEKKTSVSNRTTVLQTCQDDRKVICDWLPLVFNLTRLQFEKSVSTTF